MFTPSDHRPLGAHIWNKEPDGFYVEPLWCSERLFEIEKFTKSIWDPCCGIGRIAESARCAGYEVFASDIADHGYPHFDGCLDFLQCERPHGANFVFNPPFDQVEQFIRHALSFIGKNDKSKVATIFLQSRLNAAHWIAELPLARVYLLTPRPSMPPGHVILAGEKPGGGTQDFCWLIFSHAHKGSPELRWLHRDRGRSMPHKPVPTDQELAAAVEKITAVVRECIAEFKAAAPALVQSLSDEEWTKLSGDEDCRRAELIAEHVDLHEVAARLPALVKIARDLKYRLPGSGKPLANIALTREQCIEVLVAAKRAKAGAT